MIREISLDELATILSSNETSNTAGRGGIIIHQYEDPQQGQTILVQDAVTNTAYIIN